MAGLGAVSPVRAGDELALPFDCGLENGRLTLQPTATERRYPIIGARDQQAITACHTARSRNCRTIMVHRFVISCGGAGVDWMRVAAAIRHADAAPAWVEDGHLNVVLAARGSGNAVPHSCFDRPTIALAGVGLQRRVALARDCAASDGRTDFDQLVLPAGFAPVGEMGARLMLGSGAAPRAANADSPLTHLVGGSRGETLVAKADAGDIVAPIPGLEPYEADYEPAYSGDQWVTIVREETDRGPVREGAGVPNGIWAWMFAAMAFATLAGLVRVRYADAWSGRFFMLSQRGSGLWTSWFSGSGRNSYGTGATAVAALLEQTQEVVSKLRGAGPLREVLLAELRLVQQRLSSVEAVAGEGAGGEVKAGMLYRALMRELERIRRIGDSAAASLSHARHETGMPRTTSEAYDVLGINADVSEGVLKKIVDALRMSWHPDHARDEEDRQVREARIRQINVAWELISANRAAA